MDKHLTSPTPTGATPGRQPDRRRRRAALVVVAAVGLIAAVVAVTHDDTAGRVEIGEVAGADSLRTRTHSSPTGDDDRRFRPRLSHQDPAGAADRADSPDDTTPTEAEGDGGGAPDAPGSAGDRGGASSGGARSRPGPAAGGTGGGSTGNGSPTGGGGGGTARPPTTTPTTQTPPTTQAPPTTQTPPTTQAPPTTIVVKDPKVTGTSVQLCRRVGDQLMVSFRVSGTGHDGQYTIEPSNPPAVIDNAGGTWVASHSITVPATTTTIPTVTYWVASNGAFPSRTVTFTVNIPINPAGCTTIDG